jgi:hypothetical protein
MHIVVKILHYDWSTNIYIIGTHGTDTTWYVKNKKYKTKKWFQKASGISDEELCLLILKCGNGLK